MINEQKFYGHGKLLLSGEYFVLDGAEALAFPTTVGQSMKVKYRKSYNPTLKWESYDPSGKKWFDAEFEFWRFKILKGEEDPNVVVLQSILQQARKQNPHFLRDEMAVEVETKLEFPMEWGLGSSSSLFYNIAQWAYISPFELLSKTMGGSGYDIACAQAMGPVLYKLEKGVPAWKTIDFAPSFSDNLFLIYLGKKQNSQQGIEHYRQKSTPDKELIKTVSRLTRELMVCTDLSTFEDILHDHEKLISNHIELPMVKAEKFNDYWGMVKSLGAWGGDFALVTTNREPNETREYFNQKGIDVFIPFRELVRLAPNFKD
jgi:mevalonate kinase